MKNLIIGGVVGLIFMAGGFWYGLQLKPLPTPAGKVATAAATSAAPAAPPPISMDALTKASESMMSLNDALKAREEKVAEREQAVKEREDELAAERAALDNSHEKFKALFEEFQQRLQLVDANQLDQLQKQAALYQGMDIDQAIDLIRVMDDASISRLFSVMDTKPLGKLAAGWKTKYPQDGPRVVAVLDGMAQVMPKDKIALNDSAAAGDSAPSATPTNSGAPAPVTPASDSTAVPPAPDQSAQPAANPDSASSPTAAPTPAPDATTPTVPDATAPADSTAPASTNSTAAPSPATASN
jgi:hypothetical protein